jgi:hypothetical protein
VVRDAPTYGGLQEFEWAGNFWPAPQAEKSFLRRRQYVQVADAVDQVRRGEHKALAAAGDTRLARTTSLWLRNPATFSAAAWRALGALRTSTLPSARAWALKERLRRLWEYTYVGAAQVSQALHAPARKSASEARRNLTPGRTSAMAHAYAMRHTSDVTRR